MRFRRYLTTALALALALAAIGPPVAFGGQREREQRRPTIVQVSDRGGFDWADAGIGAAAGLALSVLAAGLVLLVSERRPTT
jgi:hypothetical protein